MKRARDKSRPMPGRTWHEGEWRTPEMIERARERARARYRRRVESDPSYLEAERERNRARYAETYVPKSNRAKPGQGKGRPSKRAPRRTFRDTPVVWKPTAAALREAATIEAILELVEESIRDDARRYVYTPGMGPGLRPVSLDAPANFHDGDGSWHEVHGDPTHWREPGYEAA